MSVSRDGVADHTIDRVTTNLGTPRTPALRHVEGRVHLAIISSAQGTVQPSFRIIWSPARVARICTVSEYQHKLGYSYTTSLN